MERILVVGATGKLGGAVLRRLIQKKHSVRALVRQPEQQGAFQALGADTVIADLTDPASLAAACSGVSHVVTTANAFLGRGRNSSALVDLEGNLNLIDAAQRAGVGRFVFTSGVIMGPDSITDFFRYKARAEEHLKKSGMDYVIVRAAAYMDEWAEIVAGKIATNGVATIFGDGANPINFIARDDVADFMVRAVEDGQITRESITLGGPENLTLLEVVSKYEQHIGRTAKRKHIPVTALRVLRRVLAFDGPTARKMSAALEIATTPQSVDIAPFRSRFPDIHLQTLDQWLSSR